ncbi:hypothetical protein [Rhizobium sp. CC-YZS058]|uniref:hypothetical protein n=1 Tax=Rhizobium sp. CC-YZS058 TaxID=3042153 RepID=UPI002B05DD40|nr:hypothetical protein [Rhizobium sp. CC-YZS058]MEA3533684.1 hypothetical protein [Rhizobium sp. CC-YZS058]
MTPEQTDRFFAHLDLVDAAEKTVDFFSEWQLLLQRTTGTLQWTTSLRLGGTLGGGVSVRLITPADVWERDVYGHIEVRSAATFGRAIRINPVEWRPRRPHHNPRYADEEHSLATYLDRWHPYAVNRRQAVAVFLQHQPGIAFPLPETITSFEAYLLFCSQVWKCSDIKDVPPPPWSPQLV